MNSFLIQNDTMINHVSKGSELTSEEIFILRTVIRSIAAVSTLGLLFVVITYWLFKSLRSFAFELVIWLCLTNMLYNIAFFLPVNEEDTLVNNYQENVSLICTLQALITTMSDLSSMLWTTIIGYTAFKSVNNHEILQTKKTLFRTLFFSITLILPLIFTLM